jgi:hypothetical protein
VNKQTWLGRTRWAASCAVASGVAAGLAGREAIGAPTITRPGFSVRLLATGIDRPFVAPGPGTGGFSGDLYVTTGSLRRIETINVAGARSVVANLAGVINGDAAFWPAFDTLGTLGGGLFFDDDPTGGPPDRVYRLTSGGLATPFASGPGTDNDAMTVDPYGSFSGDILLHDGMSLQSLYRIGLSGTPTLLATNVPDRSGQITVAPAGAFGGAAYIPLGTPGDIAVVAPTHAPGTPAPRWAGFKASHPTFEATGAAFSTSGAFGTGVMYVSGSGRVVMVNSAGQALGELGTGFGAATTLHLPTSGNFANTLVVVSISGGEIYVVTPPCAGDTNGDGAVTFADITAVLGNFGSVSSPLPGPGDANFDGAVTFGDITTVLSQFGTSCS